LSVDPSPQPRHPILVTGSHRSGSTWVGRTLALSPRVAYIHEPFHVERGRAGDGLPVHRWFTYVCEENGAAFEGAIEHLLDRAARAGAAAGDARPLIKDPFAVFSAAWFASRFRTRNVVVIRHPAAFAGSLKATGWTHPFADFLDQPLLMRDHLAASAGRIMRFAREPHDIVDQAALLWSLVYGAVARYQDMFPGWIYVRHEDLTRDPVSEFRHLFAALDLEFTDAMARTIEVRAVAPWTKRLTAEEIARVRSQVADVSSRFYSDREW
jgi:hypothetical protein